MKGFRVWAEIDLGALRHNISVVRHAVGARVRILAVVKGDAYGHGALPIARTALEAGCDLLGVGDSGEALELRNAGFPGPLLILGAIVEEEVPEVVRHDISVTVHSPDLLPLLDEEARRRGRRLRVHLKIDTGMSRLGAPPGRAVEIARTIQAAPHLEFEGLSTHFAFAADADATRAQLDLFRGVVDDLAEAGLSAPILHAANSVALFSYPETHFDMVRPGGALYGIDPGGVMARLGLSLKPVLSLRTQVAYLKAVPEGTHIGYGKKYCSTAATRIATCPAGYDDGYPYALSGRAEAMIRGRRVPVVGPVTMDYIMLDVGGIPEAQVGDEVTLIGDGLRVEELAWKIGTIPYEVTCRLGKRVRRVALETAAAAAAPRAMA